MNDLKPIPRKILKFGGTSLANADRMRQVAEIVRAAASDHAVTVVVSAMGGVTNHLVEATRAAADRDDSWREALIGLRARHLEVAEGLAEGPEYEALESGIVQSLGDLEDLLHGIFLLRECSPRTRDSVLSFGERLSAPLVAACLRGAGLDARAVDARGLLVTDDAFGRATLQSDASHRAIREYHARTEPGEVPVVTGFIAATLRGETTTLGRGGSDFTASIFGEALDAQVIELWTDVSGVMSADPRLVEDAFPLPRISYDELMELSHFGARVVHPPSVHPARRRGIPLAIRNTLDPTAPGTLIQSDSVDNPYPVRGISSIHRVDLLRLEGDGMVGVPGIAMRLFGCLARAGVSIILISQASSEHSICWAISPDDTAAAQKAVEGEFELELGLGRVDPLIIDRGQSVIAVVGEGMRERPGLASRLFGGLARAGINVRAVAQGSSELNISLVIAGDDEVRALRAIHSTFFAPTARRVRLVLLGTGKVGSELLEQTRSLIPKLLSERDIDLRWVAIANSRRLLTGAQGINLDQWQD
ncbi:MAG: aspartate kinase, partial [Thermoanaerobaculia bacterium]|nr:aspartate kinase [Thermoanaerobaculia bacterium]